MTDHLSLQNLDRADLLRWSAQVREMLMSGLGDERGVHLETAVSGIAAVAGCLMLRSTNVRLDRLPPGQPVFIDAVNELGPKYFDFLVEVCAGLGIESRGGWTDLVSSNHQPHQSVFALIQLLESAYAQLCEQCRVPAPMRVQLALFTAVRLVEEGRQMLPLNEGKALILSALVAGSKTVPPLTKTPKPFWRLFV